MAQIQLGDIVIEVEKKNIKNINLRVYPPHGVVRISAPYRVNQDTIRSFALSRLEWIKKQQLRVRSRVRELPNEVVDGESHYLNGERYLLKVIEADTLPGIELKQQAMIMHVRPGTTREKRQKLLDDWYRAQLKKIIPGLIVKWEDRLKVKISEFGIKKMRTRWGTCNRKAKRIWLNLELAKQPPHCLEYVVVHEMVHLLEKNHNKQFYSLLEKFYPEWRNCRIELAQKVIV